MALKIECNRKEYKRVRESPKQLICCTINDIFTSTKGLSGKLAYLSTYDISIYMISIYV